MTAPQFEALLAVQDLDTHLDQLRHRRATLPERAELAAAETEADRIESQLVAARAARDEVAARQTALEADLAQSEQRAETVSRRMYSGEVAASRDLSAMAADVEHQRARASDLEDQILALLEEREPFDGAVDALETERSSVAARIATAKEVLAGAEAVVDAEIADTDKRRTEATAGVPSDLLATYDRLRSRLQGVGAARLVGGRCDGCHLSLPATEVDRIRHLPDDALITCDQCGRILVRP
ncbi:MAG: hypothetical protein J2P57_24875 [Acidimicrobiaceae bacterium]|nr:hypothetical protein [Acidimicrobiaceae bacterium]